MTLDDLLAEGRAIWGSAPMGLPHIAVAAAVVTGDLARAARDLHEGLHPDMGEVAKELGNLVCSAVRWADDLGLEVETCVAVALDAQRAYVARRAT